MKKEKKIKHNIVILCAFFISNVFCSHMSEYNECAPYIDITKYEKLSLSQLYQKLNEALHSNNIQSIWELSKAITRIHFRESEL